MVPEIVNAATGKYKAVFIPERSPITRIILFAWVQLKYCWCESGDSNPDTLRRQILSLVRLPISPLSLVCHQALSADPFYPQWRGHGKDSIRKNTFAYHIGKILTTIFTPVGIESECSYLHLHFFWLRKIQTMTTLYATYNPFVFLFPSRGFYALLHHTCCLCRTSLEFCSCSCRFRHTIGRKR